jgi:hypothetical protein
MSSPINFQSDAMECLRMAEQAKGQEERAVLVDLARAWVLLGEQLNQLDPEKNSDLPSPLNSLWLGPGPFDLHLASYSRGSKCF